MRERRPDFGQKRPREHALYDPTQNVAQDRRPSQARSLPPDNLSIPPPNFLIPNPSDILPGRWQSHVSLLPQNVRPSPPTPNLTNYVPRNYPSYPTPSALHIPSIELTRAPQDVRPHARTITQQPMQLINPYIRDVIINLLQNSEHSQIPQIVKANFVVALIRKIARNLTRKSQHHVTLKRHLGLSIDTSSDILSQVLHNLSQECIISKIISDLILQDRALQGQGHLRRHPQVPLLLGLQPQPPQASTENIDVTPQGIGPQPYMAWRQTLEAEIRYALNEHERLCTKFDDQDHLCNVHIRTPENSTWQILDPICLEKKADHETSVQRISHYCHLFLIASISREATDVASQEVRTYLKDLNHRIRVAKRRRPAKYDYLKSAEYCISTITFFYPTDRGQYPPAPLPLLPKEVRRIIFIRRIDSLLTEHETSKHSDCWKVVALPRRTAQADDRHELESMEECQFSSPSRCIRELYQIARTNHEMESLTCQRVERYSHYLDVRVADAKACLHNVKQSANRTGITRLNSRYEQLLKTQDCLARINFRTRDCLSAEWRRLPEEISLCIAKLVIDRVLREHERFSASQHAHEECWKEVRLARRRTLGIAENPGVQSIRQLYEIGYVNHAFATLVRNRIRKWKEELEVAVREKEEEIEIVHGTSGAEQTRKRLAMLECARSCVDKIILPERQ